MINISSVSQISWVLMSKIFPMIILEAGFLVAAILAYSSLISIPKDVLSPNTVDAAHRKFPIPQVGSKITFVDI